MTKYLSCGEETDIDTFEEPIEVLSVVTVTRGTYFIRRNKQTKPFIFAVEFGNTEKCIK